MLSRSFFDAHPEEFFRFYRDKMLNPGAKPNAAHKKLAELEAAGKLRSVITRTSTAYTRRPGPSGCGSSTARCCATGA